MPDVNVIQRTQVVDVNIATNSVAVTNAGPIGPAGPEGGISEGELDAAVDARVAKAGDTMTGLLILSGDPVNPLGAATRQFVLANAGSGGGGGSSDGNIDGGSPSSVYGGTAVIDGGTP